jgi:pyruvate,water dikinase
LIIHGTLVGGSIPRTKQPRSASWSLVLTLELCMSELFSETALVVPFEHLRMTDVESVGGKNASLGEMISQLPSGVRVPTGFATTAHAFREFLAFDGLTERINARLDALDT